MNLIILTRYTYDTVLYGAVTYNVWDTSYVRAADFGSVYLAVVSFTWRYWMIRNVTFIGN